MKWSVRRLGYGARPILVGPWRSELGFEVSYWLPWLAWLRQTLKIPRERIIAVTRGGAGVWYDAAHVVDLYDYVPIDKIRKAMLKDQQAKGSIKQHGITPWEQKLIPLIADDLGLRRYILLHPSVLYQRFSGWWGDSLPMRDVVKELVFSVPPIPAPPLTLALPERFVAVRFYARHTWPYTDDLRNMALATVESLAKRIPVVVLESGLHADDHLDFPLSGENILSIKSHVTPQNNLAVQSAVIAKAQGFVGTYGGTMQLAVRLRKPAIGFYNKFDGTAYAHKVLTEWLAVQQKVPCFIGRPEDAKYVMEAMLP